jgi:hypothetical protein
LGTFKTRYGTTLADKIKLINKLEFAINIVNNKLTVPFLLLILSILKVTELIDQVIELL